MKRTTRKVKLPTRIQLSMRLMKIWASETCQRVITSIPLHPTQAIGHLRTSIFLKMNFRHLNKWNVICIIALAQKTKKMLGYSVSPCVRFFWLHLTCKTSGNDILTNIDRDNIRAFQLKMLGNLPCTVFNRMRHTFSHKMELNSEWVVTHRIAILTGIEPVIYHCCFNSCLAFTGRFIHHETCIVCKEPRYTGGQRPRATFVYLPLRTSHSTTHSPGLPRTPQGLLSQIEENP